MASFPVDPEDPLAPARGQSLDGLLRLLEQLDGAEEAGFDLVVPRSRMAREGPALVDRLARMSR